MKHPLIAALPIVLLSAACASTTYEPAAPTTLAPPAVARETPRAPAATHASARPQPRIDLASIHAALDAYGEWDTDSERGEVWVPSPAIVGTQFVPYGSNGRWVRTDAGWYWQSDYPWGWLVFHYGRWVRLGDHTWAWMPGDTFAPAWVDWRVAANDAADRGDDDVVGWAPLGPDGPPSADLYAYVSFRFLFELDFWSYATYGPGGLAYYGTTQGLDPADGYGGATYGWGPHCAPGTASADTTPLARAWAADGRAPRAGAPTSDGAHGAPHAEPAGESDTSTRRQPRPSVRITVDNDPITPDIMPIDPAFIPVAPGLRSEAGGAGAPNSSPEGASNSSPEGASNSSPEGGASGAGGSGTSGAPSRGIPGASAAASSPLPASDARATAGVSAVRRTIAHYSPIVSAVNPSEPHAPARRSVFEGSSGGARAWSTPHPSGSDSSSGTYHGTSSSSSSTSGYHEPAYQAPAYHAPAPTPAPAYHAPAYHAPAPSPAPAHSAPSAGTIRASAPHFGAH